MRDDSSEIKKTLELRYPRRGPFFKALNERVNEAFGGKSRAGGQAIVRKSLVIASWWLVSYLLLLFFAHGPLQFLLFGLSLAMAIAGIGFSIQHDGGHASYSDNPTVNRWAARALDLIGGSSWIWKSKHNYLHHHYTNIEGVDADLQDGSYMRLAPSQPYRPIQRWQKYYAWFLYGLLPVKWHFVDDFMNLGQQKIGAQSIRLKDPKEIRFMLLSKVVFYAWGLGLPIYLHGWVIGVLGYLYVSFCLGVTLAVVFQLAHCVNEASFVEKPTQGETLPMQWAEHQVRTTVNFAPTSRFWTWYLGGLNYQIEHHLFPKVSHIHYPKLSPIVRATCQEFEIPYFSHPSVARAVLAHYRFLQRMGTA